MEQRLSLCRTCLKAEAIHPLNEGYGESCILNKLAVCFNEKLDHIDGYPNICDECCKNVDTLYNFIKRIKSINTILKNGLLKSKTKTEIEHFHNIDDAENELIDVMYEKETKDNSDFIDNHTCKIPSIPINMRSRSKKHTFLRKSNNKIINKINTATGKESRSICLKGNIIMDKQVDKKAKRLQHVELDKSTKVKASQQPKLCHICGEVCNGSEELSNHKQKKHNKEAKCPECQKTFVSSYYLMKHTKRIHGGTKDFVCSKCTKGFAFKNELTSHMSQVHNKKVVEKKTFSCKICNKMYNCEKSVIIHTRSVHTGERPAICSVCGQGFYHDEYLRQHMRLHTGETPFKCPICGRGYAQQGNMKSHLRIHKKSELDSDTLSKIRPSHLRLLKP